MSLFEDAMSIAVQLPIGERERLARALGLNVHTKGPGTTLPLNQFVSRPNPATDPAQSAAWRKAETGHAVLNTEASALAASAEVPEGPRALFNLWSTPELETTALGEAPLASSLPRNSPVIVHTDVCAELAYGRDAALAFFENPPVEVRLATATYLALLNGAQEANELRHVQQFVKPYAVLSLGPMASSRSVELMLANSGTEGFNPLDALIAATALAHEIPLVVRDPRPFQNIRELRVVRAY